MGIFKKRFRLLAGVLVLLASAGCDRTGSSGLRPTEPEPLLGLGGQVGGYHLANDPVLAQTLDATVSVTRLIGSGGGSLELYGHRLTVPSGAVLEPTLFTLAVVPSGYVQVELSATVRTLLGVLNLGEKGFRKPVPVTLTYRRSTNVSDPTTLFVLREKGLFRKPEPLPSRVDPVTKTVTADLDRFSRYFLAYP